eukprot:COSAG01_NODE_3371_length_6179_cov_1.762336_6_plen_202_part_00
MQQLLEREGASLDLNHVSKASDEAVRAGFFPQGTAMMCAVLSSNVAAIRLLLGRGADSATSGIPNAMPPVETAAFRADTKVLAAFHAAGMEVTGHGPHGFSTLHLAAKSLREQGNAAKSVKFLVKKVGMAVDTRAQSPAPNWTHSNDDVAATSGQTPLMTAVGSSTLLKSVEALLKVTEFCAFMLAGAVQRGHLSSRDSRS